MFVKCFRRSVLLMLLAASPGLAVTLGVLPAQPVEESPFTVVIGTSGGCPKVDTVTITPGRPGLVMVSLEDVCVGSPTPALLEIPLGPFPSGPWNVRVQGVPGMLSVDVARLPFHLELDPAVPRAGSPFKVRLIGSGTCLFLGPAKQDGLLLTLLFDDNCPILPPAPSPMVVEQTVDPLLAGNYVVQAMDFFGHTVASSRLHVAGPAECAPSDTVLCLQQGRFRVEANWRTGNATGVAHAHPETADSGALWFFGPDNLEVLVKVLNACPTPSAAFWVYAAGLTDVEVDITVTDEVTQRTKRYHNPLGKPFAPILDSAAFSCSLPPGA
jgi:hypothetical protein